MTSNKSKSRSSSKSPTQAPVKPDSKHTKIGDGGVKVPNEGQKVDEKNPREATHANSVVPVISGAATGSQANGVKPADWKVNQPNGNVTGVNGNAISANHSAKLSGNATTFKPKPAPIHYLNHDSMADDAKPDDTGPLIVSSDVTSKASHTAGKGKATQEPIGTRGVNFSPTRKVYWTTDVGPNALVPGGHYIKMVNVHNKDMHVLLKALYDNHGWESKLRGITSPAKPNSNYYNVFCAFDDIRDAKTAFQEIHLVNTKVNTEYVSQTEYAQSQLDDPDRGTQEPTTFFHGQVIFNAQFKGLSSEIAAQHVAEEIEEFAKSMGEVCGFAERENAGGICQFRAEFYKISAALNVLQTITKATPKQLGNWTIYAEEMSDCGEYKRPAQAIYKLENDLQCFATPHKVVAGEEMINTSPTGRTAWKYDENGEKIPVAPPKQLPKTYTNAAPWGMVQHPRHLSDPLPETPSTGYMGIDHRIYSNSWSAPSGQVYSYEDLPYGNTTPAEMYGTPTSVDVEKILTGQDVRTTVMLRNLPNNMTFHQLKQILDAVCFGRYDFSYLRVDFGNNMNVGYGFVNFTDPMYIVDFVNRYVGRPWIQPRYSNRKRGPRIADVSYATVQGYDCLVEKFRNSSVMDEYPDYRPKLWWTYDNASNPALVGTEVNFPKPNNPSKHQRSRDNATQVGLYTSGNRRNRNHHGNRNRRSQYDRGTSAQMREDAHFNQQFMHMSPLQNGYMPNYMLSGPPMPVGPPPRFPIMPVPGINGFVLPHGNGALNAFGYGPIQFTDPFVNSGYQAGHHVQGLAQMNSGYVGQPQNQVQTTTNGRRFYHSEVDCNRIPKAIAEEDSSAIDDTSYPSGQDVQGHNGAFGSHY